MLARRHKVIPSETQGMYRVRFPDGSLSADHYNLSHAKTHVYALENGEEHINGYSKTSRGILREMGVRMPLQAAQRLTGALFGRV